jgi:(p)ppGpp synthase/HD superfamily hydrolase
MPEVKAPDRLLSLSLEEITEQLGEEGLRERFSLEIKRFTDDEQALIMGALELATMLHADERRAREPYINHVLRVAVRVMSDPELIDVDVVVAAILHDTVENHHDKLLQDELVAQYDWEALEVEMRQAMALDTIQTMFNERVAGLVAVVTNPPVEADMPLAKRHEKYRINVVEKLSTNPDARVIKAGDVLDNTADLESLYDKNKDKARSLATKYGPMLDQLAELINLEDTPLSYGAKQRTCQQLERSGNRCKAILEMVY